MTEAIAPLRAYAIVKAINLRTSFRHTDPSILFFIVDKCITVGRKYEPSGSKKLSNHIH